MKTIEIDDALYHFIAKNTQYIGESASDILRRLLALQESSETAIDDLTDQDNTVVEKTEQSATVSVQAEKEIATHSDDVFNYISQEELAMQRGAVGRFLLILAALYRVNQHSFSNVLSIRGRDRLYFAKTENELLESGSSIKPRQIPNSPYWVMTNSNTTRKKMMLTEAALSLGYSAEDAEKIRELL